MCENVGRCRLQDVDAGRDGEMRFIYDRRMVRGRRRHGAPCIIVYRPNALKRTCGIRVYETLTGSLTPSGQLNAVWNSEVIEKKMNDRMVV